MKRIKNPGVDALDVAFLTLWLFFGLGSLALTATTYYIAWHFITKFW